MKRNRYGINFDLGVPLLSNEEIEILYVEMYAEQKQRLIDWMKNENEAPIIVAGQIGTGKTTLIEKAFQESSSPWDIQVKLDTDVPMPLYGRGAFWGFCLGKVLDFARQLEIDVSIYNLPEDLIQVKYANNGPELLINRLTEMPMAISDFNNKKKLYNLVDENIDIIKIQLLDIIKKIENNIQRKLFFFAEGIDKFHPHTADYVSVVDLLNFLSQCKTLYEANLIHLLGAESWHNRSSKKVFLTGASNERLIEILTKRMGVYVKSREEMLPILSALSGGNVRQAVRLLMEFDEAVGKKRKDIKEALDYACRRVRNDLLDILSGSIDAELLKVVNRDKYITSGTLSDFAGREISQNAIYNNWILISDEADRELKWKANINPLLLPAIETFQYIPESPETELIREWAETHEVSPFGLEIGTSAVDKNKFFDIIGSESTLIPLDIMETFECMAAYFLSPERKDKIIIAYENKELVRLANDFIIGKAGTYKPGNFKNISFEEVPEGQLDIYLDILSKEQQHDGYSIFFEKKLTPAELIALDQRRDAFNDYKMIWWIPYEDLKGYLKYWPQLRQFFKVYRLEEDIFGSLTREGIEQDLLLLDSIDFPEELKKDIKEKLERILNTLDERTKSNG